MRSVLIVEDNRKNAEVAIRACQEQRWNVAWAKNGMDALGFIVSIPFDAVVLDMNLPAFVEESVEMAQLDREPRRYPMEGTAILRLLTLMPDRLPKVVVAFSGIPMNNDLLMLEGATKRVEGKSPEALTKILSEAFLSQEG